METKREKSRKFEMYFNLLISKFYHQYKADKRLLISMTRMGFDVVVLKNVATAADVLKFISAFVLRGDQIDCNAFGLAFMSHGHKNGLMATYKDFINVQAIKDQVKASHALVGKPKLLIFQGNCLILYKLYSISYSGPYYL